MDRSLPLKARVKQIRAHFFEDFLDGTLPPSFRACESPIAIACFRLFTFLPEPLFSVPFLRSCMAFSTFSDALLPYLAMVTLQLVADPGPFLATPNAFTPSHGAGHDDFPSKVFQGTRNHFFPSGLLVNAHTGLLVGYWLVHKRWVSLL